MIQDGVHHSIIVWFAVFSAITLVGWLWWAPKERLACDGQTLLLHLRHYRGAFLLTELVSLQLAEEVNDLTLATKGSHHVVQLYGFQRWDIVRLMALAAPS